MSKETKIATLKRLDFICIGVQKGGTTTLHSLLRNHTDIVLSAEKELHFFDNEARDWCSLDYSDYHKHFEGEEEGKMWGEITPIYIYMPQCLERIYTYNPNVKLIAVFRDPVDRAFSHWCMEFDRGCENLSFADAIRDPGRRRFGTAGWHRVFSYVERGFYGRQLAKVFSLFPRESVLCLDYELVVQNQASLLERIAGFVGARVLSLPTKPMHEHKNSTVYPLPNEKDSQYLREIYSTDLELFGHLSGIDLRRPGASGY